MSTIKSKIVGNSGTGVLTSEVRFCFVNVFEPRKNEDGTNGKYGVCLVIPKTDNLLIANIRTAIDNAASIGEISKFGGKIPKNIYSILHDGDEKREDDETFKNCYYINASCKTKPGIIDVWKNDIVDTTEFYSGCYGLATLNFYAYSTNGNKGVACGLNNIMKLRDGEHLGGRVRADVDFADIDLEIELDEF